MANENILRRNWDEHFQTSPELRKAEADALGDQVARDARFKAAKRRAAGNPGALIELLNQERAEVGTGNGEIALETKKRVHAKEVRDYINDATKRQQALAAKNTAFVNIQADPDFATHRPYAKNVRTGATLQTKEQAAANTIKSTEWSGALNGGRSMSSTEKANAYRKYGPDTVAPQDVFDGYQAETRAQAEREKAFDEGNNAAVTQDRKAAGGRMLATQRNTAAVNAALGKGPVRINTRDFQFGSGGTMERDGRQYGVPAGIGSRGMTETLDQNPAYRMDPADFVSSAPVRAVTSETPPSYPVVKPAGKTRPAATLISSPPFIPTPFRRSEIY